MFSSKSRMILLFLLFLFLLINPFLAVYSVWIQVIGTFIAGLVAINLLYVSFVVRKENTSDVNHKSQQPLDSLIEEIPIPILIMNKKQEFVYTSNEFNRLLTRTASDLKSVDIEMRNIITDALESPIEQIMKRNYHYRVYNIFSKRVNRDHHLFIFNDITAVVTEQRNTKRFLGDVSHELKTPITAIKGITQVLIDNKEEDPKIVHEFLKQILLESERLNMMVSDMLMISKLSSHFISIDKSTFDLSVLVNQVKRTFLEEYAKKNILLEHDEHSVIVNTDYEKLRTILNNLVANALNYSEVGPVNINYFYEEPNIVIEVSDNGIGMTEKQIANIYERFYRVDTARNRKIGGSGLGLSITKELVKELGGTIDVKSKINKGSTFTIKIPKS